MTMKFIEKILSLFGIKKETYAEPVVEVTVAVEKAPVKEPVKKVQPEAPVVKEEAKVEKSYIAWDDDTKEAILDKIRPIVKNYAHGDKLDLYEEKMNENTKSLKTYSKLIGNGDLLMVKFTQSDAYNRDKDFVNFIKDYIVKDIEEAVSEIKGIEISVSDNGSIFIGIVE